VFAPGRRATECAALAERVQVVLSADDRVDIRQVLATLDERGYRRISCEGGPHLFGELVAHDLLDELCLTLAPLLLPGDALRVTQGVAITQPLRLRPAGFLQDDGFLFSRWLRR
jgi:riboflavin biosynthesis pyrimidine reductase